MVMWKVCKCLVVTYVMVRHESYDVTVCACVCVCVCVCARTLYTW